MTASCRRRASYRGIVRQRTGAFRGRQLRARLGYTLAGFYDSIDRNAVAWDARATRRFFQRE